MPQEATSTHNAVRTPRALTAVRRWPRAAVVAALVALGALWRLWLIPRYAGWEESDYGDLAMIRGALDARFLHYDMHHMPGYYALGGLVLALVGDAVIAAKATSLLGGLAALGLAVDLSDRVFGRTAAWITGVLLVFQPEFALYASSALREPVYAAFMLGCLHALLAERLSLASALAGAAFLIRMDGALAIGVPLLVHAVGRGPSLRRGAAALGPLALVIAGWAAYCQWDHGTWRFWEGAAAVNVETGLGGEHADPLGWTANGLRVAGTLVAWVMPGRIGWGVWLGLLYGLLHTAWTRPGIHRTIALAAVTFTGVWGGIGLVAQHDPDHNLYWKWLCGVVPMVVPLGVAGLLRAVGARRWAPVWIGLVVAQALGAGLVETKRQLDLSNQLYRPQLTLAQWIEAEVPEPTPMILDNIPACWIRRNPTERPLWTWMDVPTPPGDEAAFSAWIREERVAWVLWFREDWTEAPRVAPFLAQGGTWRGDGVRLVEQSREDAYGWIFYKVQVEEGR